MAEQSPDTPAPSREQCLEAIQDDTCGRLRHLQSKMEESLCDYMAALQEQCESAEPEERRRAYEAVLAYKKYQLSQIKGENVEGPQWFDLADPSSESFIVDTSRPIHPDDLLDAMQGYKGYQYRYGAKGEKHTVDCSGLLTESLNNLGVCQGPWLAANDLFLRASIPRDIDHEIPKRGDFVFWIDRKGPKKGKATHVAVVNQVLADGRVRVTQSSEGRGYSETEIIDLRTGGNKKYEYALGAPIFYA